jgi:hypothetical protein
LGNVLPHGEKLPKRKGSIEGDTSEKTTVKKGRREVKAMPCGQPRGAKKVEGALTKECQAGSETLGRIN